MCVVYTSTKCKCVCGIKYIKTHRNRPKSCTCFTLQQQANGISIALKLDRVCALWGSLQNKSEWGGNRAEKEDGGGGEVIWRKHGRIDPWAAGEDGSCPPCSILLHHLWRNTGCGTWPSVKREKTVLQLVIPADLLWLSLTQHITSPAAESRTFRSLYCGLRSAVLLILERFFFCLELDDWFHQLYYILLFHRNRVLEVSPFFTSCTGIISAGCSHCRFVWFWYS